MNAQRLIKIDRLRARDGDNCWLCDGVLDFSAAPNSKKSPSIEHLEPKAAGGTGHLENLALCHPGCNRQLADHPREKKESIKAKIAERRKHGAKLASVSVRQKSAVTAPTPRMAAAKTKADGSDRFWIATAVAAFFAGISFGQLLS